MITNTEHKNILDIVEKYGGDNKVALRKNILTLLKNHDRMMKRKIISAIEKIDE